MKYSEFISQKMEEFTSAGFEPIDAACPLFDWQSMLVKKALENGRYCLFTDTGTGKTIMQIEWARQVSISSNGRVLIVAPLAVADQTVAEGWKFGVNIKYLREDDGITPLVITNYEMIDKFDEGMFDGVVLDESSIIKSFTGKIRNQIINKFKKTKFRLACTATPSPNDFMELGNHSEFLGVKTRTEMLAEYFVHDGSSTQDWRLKGHAKEPFWRWVCSWAAIMSKPSDLGYDDDKYLLPELIKKEYRIDVAFDSSDGMLFADRPRTLSEQRAERKKTMLERVGCAAAIANETSEPVLIWCEYNSEGDELEKMIPDAVQVSGADDLDVKRERLIGFSSGKYRVLITKPKIAGFGMNWQHCNQMIFVGVSHSFEQTYQAIRRCWRFGQDKKVIVHQIRTDGDQIIIDNLARKERAHVEMKQQMIKHASNALKGSRRWNEYDPTKKMDIPSWL